MLGFNVTGFGQFHGVSDNPTTHLVHNLSSSLAYNPLPQSLQIQSCTVLHVSGERSLQTLNSLNRAANDVSPKSRLPQRTIWLHFGVASDATSIRIEAKAYNEADFRCPDELGWQPENQRIVEGGAPVLTSTLNVDQLVARLSAIGHNVTRSEDPGRFVCNWLYYHSLLQSQQDDSHSLFIHMPTFTCVNSSDQLQFALDLIYLLAELFGMKDNNESIRVSVRNLSEKIYEESSTIAAESR